MKKNVIKEKAIDVRKRLEKWPKDYEHGNGWYVGSITVDQYDTIRAEHKEMLEALIKIYPDVSEEMEEDVGICLRDIIEKATGKPIEDALREVK